MKNKKYIVLLLIIVALAIIPVIIKLIQNNSKNNFIKEVESTIENYQKYNSEVNRVRKVDVTDKRVALENSNLKNGTLMAFNDEIEVYYVTDGKYCAYGKLGKLKIIEGKCPNKTIDDILTKKFLLNIDPNGGFFNKKQEEYNFKIINNEENIIPNATKENSTFEGWDIEITTGDNENELDFISTKLVAKWNDSKEKVELSSIESIEDTINNELSNNYNLEQFNIKINPNGGEYENKNSVINLSLDKLNELTLSNPRKNGYNFIGWGIRYSAEKENKNNIKITLEFEAKYEAIPNTLEIDLNDGENSVKKVSIKTDKIYELPKPEREGYKFVGWETNTITATINESNTSLTMGAENVKITAKWKKIYYLTIDLNGGTGYEKLNYELISGERLQLNSPTKTGYIFYNWQIIGSGSKVENDTFIMGDEDVELIASWAEEKYEVQIYLNGGYSNQQLNHDLSPKETLSLVKPTKKGYIFTGWRVNGRNSRVKGNSFEMGNENATIEAKWKPINYKLIYDLKGGNANNKSTYNIETQSFRLVNPEKTGYSFIGWTTKNNSTPIKDVIVTKGSVGDKEFIANYEPIFYEIVLESNNDAIERITYTIENEVKLPTLIKENAIFDGWYETTDYRDERITKISKGTTGNKKLYAKWIIKYTINLDINSNLPEEYTMLNYIETTGEQYIDTGYSNNAGFRADATLALTKINGAESLFGSHNLRSPYARNYFGIDDDGKRWNIGTGDIYIASTQTINIEQVYNVSLSTLTTNSYLSIDGNQIIKSTDSKSRSTANVLIFACQWSLKYNDYLAQMRLYSMKIYGPNNELAREFIPSINKDGVIGLYDLINDKFYENAGEGTFKYEEILPSTENKVVVTLGENYGQLPTPKREGYEFKGWYTSKNDGEKIKNDTKVTEKSNNQTLYARWEKIIQE